MIYKTVPDMIAGTTLTGSTRRLFERALHVLGRPIEVERFNSGDIGFAGAGGSSKVLKWSGKIWLPNTSVDFNYTISHELGHMIVSEEQGTLRMDPINPKPPYRQSIGTILSWIEHVPAHDVMSEYGFDPRPEVHDRCIALHGEVVGMKAALKGTEHKGIALGLADKRIQANGTEPILADIDAVLREVSPQTLAFADRLSAIVTRDRVRQRDWSGMWSEIVQAWPIGPQFSQHVYTQDAFRKKFGY